MIFWLLLTGQSKIAFFVFVCAGISDAVDGYLAKRFDWSTELGSYLDPLADKLLIVSIFIALGVRNELPLWLVIAVVSRDILIVAAVLLAWLLDQPVRDQAAGGQQGQYALPDRAGRHRPGRRGLRPRSRDEPPGAGVDDGSIDAAFARRLSPGLVHAHDQPGGRKY